MVYKNNDVRLELSRLAKQGDPKMKVGLLWHHKSGLLVHLRSRLSFPDYSLIPLLTRCPYLQVSGVVSFKCESVATLDPVTFDTPESFVALNKWTAKKAGSISFDFRTTEPNGLMLFSHGKPRQQQRKDSRSPPTVKVTDSPQVDQTHQTGFVLSNQKRLRNLRNQSADNTLQSRCSSAGQCLV